jgi:3-hydroxyisobutyrate dehydrogenase-like beta-hydroxyacid dehydrogenase
MKLCLIGYGEVGKILAEDLRMAGHQVMAFDMLLQQEASPGAALMQSHASQFGVKLAENSAAAVKGAQLVISAVTASQTLAVAQGCASAIEPQAFFLDFNSASPGAKQQAAQVIDAAGGRYVEGAVMTSLPPYRIKVPLLLGGPYALVLKGVLDDLGFSAAVASDKVGVASATKMCRSVMIKGMEAMVIESLTAARHYGVEDAVIASLVETFPGIEWEKQAAYFFQRAIEHGKRRAEEVREVAVTVSDAGLEPFSAAGTAQRQQFIADLTAQGVFGQRGAAGFARSPNWRVEADRLLAAVKPPTI